MTSKSVLVYALILLTAAPRLTAQQHDEASEIWRSYAERLPSGAFVKIRLTNGPQLKGHVIQVTAEAVRVSVKTRIPVPARYVRFTDIESMATAKEGKSPGTKVLIGAGIGGAAIVTGFLLMLAALTD